MRCQQRAHLVALATLRFLCFALLRRAGGRARLSLKAPDCASIAGAGDAELCEGSGVSGSWYERIPDMAHVTGTGARTFIRGGLGSSRCSPRAVVTVYNQFTSL